MALQWVKCCVTQTYTRSDKARSTQKFSHTHTHTKTENVPIDAIANCHTARPIWKKKRNLPPRHLRHQSIGSLVLYCSSIDAYENLLQLHALKFENLFSFIYEFNRSNCIKNRTPFFSFQSSETHLFKYFFCCSCYCCCCCFFVCFGIECENSTRFSRSFDSIWLETHTHTDKHKTQLNSTQLNSKRRKRKHQHTNGIEEQLCCWM